MVHTMIGRSSSDKTNPYSGGSTWGHGGSVPPPPPRPARVFFFFFFFLGGGGIFIDLTVQISCFVTIYIFI